MKFDLFKFFRKHRVGFTRVLCVILVLAMIVPILVSSLF